MVNDLNSQITSIQNWSLLEGQEHETYTIRFTQNAKIGFGELIAYVIYYKKQYLKVETIDLRPHLMRLEIGLQQNILKYLDSQLNFLEKKYHVQHLKK